MQGKIAGGPGKCRSYAALALVLLIATGCATVPDADEDIAEAAATSSPRSTILGADGPLTIAESHRLLSRVAKDASQDALLQRHLAIEQAVARTPLTAGNKTELLRDGNGTFAAIFTAIRGARHHVNLEYYTLEDVTYDGERLGDLLIAKRQAGVAVNIIYDSYGSSDTPSKFFARLKKAGVNLLSFHPVNPLEAAASGYSPNDRNHRKIMIVDGRVAVIGGVNLATYYQSKAPGKETGSKRPEAWRDLSIRIEGPAVEQLQGLFLGHWRSERGPKLDQSDFFPKLPARNGEIVRIIGSSPQQDVSRYYVTLISAIRNAERRIWLTTAYFVPTFEEKVELQAAAERGVDVRLILPAVSDASQAIAIARSHYSDLLESGARIFEIDNVTLHSKAVTIDGVWSAIGSSNFDHRSVLFNDEVDAIVLGNETADALEKIFEEDQGTAKEIKLEEWRRRPLIERVGDFFQRGWQYLM
ncbi:MAG TPA: phospholipase D-like domain-containing protein [Dongiaceae bacterium]|jgi:cardiolipin synthase|nr:phospholipase D-like domain-containing protein [Dongiaceae bacterium]